MNNQKDNRGWAEMENLPRLRVLDYIKVIALTAALYGSASIIGGFTGIGIAVVFFGGGL